jgi:hypothetical protein
MDGERWVDVWKGEDPTLPGKRLEDAGIEMRIASAGWGAHGGGLGFFGLFRRATLRLDPAGGTVMRHSEVGVMAEIGFRLTRAREARGLTLEDAERDTRISRRYLEALETEQFEVIPAPVYARGFLRSYSQYLGMDPQEVLGLFPRGDDGSPPPAVNGSAPQRASLETPIPGTSPSRPAWRKPPRFDSGRPPQRGEPRGRHREPPPPFSGRTTATEAELVIGGKPIPRKARNPSPSHTPVATAPFRAPQRPAEPVIGQEPARATPTRRLERHPAESSRNLVVIAATAGVVLVVAGVVPAVRGEKQDAAVRAIEQAGLKARVITDASAEPEGTVIDQSPAAGTQLAPGSEVRIVVSAGQ